jgi:hypothetical protein
LKLLAIQGAAHKQCSSNSCNAKGSANRIERQGVYRDEIKRKQTQTKDYSHDKEYLSLTCRLGQRSLPSGRVFPYLLPEPIQEKKHAS